MICNLLTSYVIDVFLPIAKWIVIGVISAVIILGVLFYFLKKDGFGKFSKTAILGIFSFLLVIGLACLIMEIGKSFSLSYAEENWLDRKALITYVLIPISIFIVLLLLSAVVLFIVSKKAQVENKNSATKKAFSICGIINLIALVVCGIMMAIYYDLKFKNDGYYNSETASVNQPVLYISGAILIIMVIALAFLLDKNDKSIDTRCISTAGITVAMSFGLSYIKLFSLPQGGTIPLFSLLPIMIFSYTYGTKKGVFVCFIYGILQAVQDPWIIHPAQFLLDYPIAFATIGLSGCFGSIRKLQNYPQLAFVFGGVLAGCMRFVSHVLSGCSPIQHMQKV